MSKCYRCGYNGGHNQQCPESLKGVDRLTAVQRWIDGNDHGRSRMPQISDDPQYVMGWIHGDAAADEAENSSSW